MPSDLAREGRLVAAAFGMLTRLPVPPWPESAGPFPADWLARSAKYFPLAGASVGGLSGAVLWTASCLWPAPIPALLAVGAGLLLTGALHEDGLADSADGSAGRTVERRLAIMKDPRLGAFGALALGLVLALKVAALSVLPPPSAASALGAAGAVSRLWPVWVMARTDYAGDRDAAKVDHGAGRPTPRDVGLATALALLAVGALAVVLPFSAVTVAFMTSAAAALAVALRLCRGLGGHTGDVLGAVVASAECAFLLGAAAGIR